MKTPNWEALGVPLPCAPGQRLSRRCPAGSSRGLPSAWANRGSDCRSQAGLLGNSPRSIPAAPAATAGRPGPAGPGAAPAGGGAAGPRPGPGCSRSPPAARRPVPVRAAARRAPRHVAGGRGLRDSAGRWGAGAGGTPGLCLNPAASVPGVTLGWGRGAAGRGLRQAGGGRGAVRSPARGSGTGPSARLLREHSRARPPGPFYGLLTAAVPGPRRYFRVITSSLTLHFLQWPKEPRHVYNCGSWCWAPLRGRARCGVVPGPRPAASRCVPSVPRVPCVPAGRLGHLTGPLLPVRAPGSRCSGAVCAGRDLGIKQKCVRHCGAI